MHVETGIQNSSGDRDIRTLVTQTNTCRCVDLCNLLTLLIRLLFLQYITLHSIRQTNNRCTDHIQNENYGLTNDDWKRQVILCFETMQLTIRDHIDYPISIADSPSLRYRGAYRSDDIGHKRTFTPRVHCLPAAAGTGQIHTNS